MMHRPRHMAILTDGHHDPETAKTAVCLLRYCPTEVTAVVDRAAAGKTCGEVFGVGGEIPVVGALAEALDAEMLVLGIAPPGGKMPPGWRPIILEAIARRLAVVSGLHDFLGEDAEFRAAAERHGASLIDLRDNSEREVARREGFRRQCLRIHTVGNDCCAGKMATAVELARGLQRRGIDAAFVATGQTGMLIARGGCAVDRVIADFLSGAAERLVLANQAHEAIVVEGQGSLFHPRYSCVSLGLLHGVLPDGLVLCYAMGRRSFFGLEHVPLPPLDRVVEFYESAAGVMHPCRVVGAAVNGVGYSDEAVAAECARVEWLLGLPACDPIRHGPEKLVEAVERLRRELGKDRP